MKLLEDNFLLILSGNENILRFRHGRLDLIFKILSISGTDFTGV